MKQLSLITFILLTFNLLSLSQSEITVLKGKVTDQEKNEGIAFVSIGIEGTFLGTATNQEGYFELRVPEEQQTKNLFFSAIGYKNISYPITELLHKQDISIVLTPQSYSIEEIDVAAESLVLQRIIRTASERIPQNYLSVASNMKLYYEHGKSTENTESKTVKAIIDLYDSNGYANPGWADAFKSRSYQITETQVVSPPYSFRDAASQLDELLELDIARLSNSILNPKLLNDFKLKMEAKTLFNGDSVWIISYKALKLDLTHTGSFYPTGYTGKIYISCADYTILRNEIHLAEAKENSQGRSLAAKRNLNTNIQMNITVGYKKTKGKYVLAFIDSEKQYVTSEKMSVYESGKIVVLDVETNNVRKIKNRDYFAEAKSNESFWQNFVIPSK